MKTQGFNLIVTNRIKDFLNTVRSKQDFKDKVRVFFEEDFNFKDLQVKSWRLEDDYLYVNIFYPKTIFNPEKYSELVISLN